MTAGIEEGLAVAGQGDPPWRAMEQLHSQLSLQPRDRFAHGGRRDAQHPRGAGEVAGFGRTDESADVAEGIHFHYSCDS
ncbi:hypothetical protein D3C71_1754880 [compost metagenome]